MTHGEGSEEYFFSHQFKHMRSLFYQEFWFGFCFVGFGCVCLIFWFGLRTLISHRISHTLNSLMLLSSPHVAAGLTSFVFFSDSHVMVPLFQLYHSHSCACLLTAKRQVQTCHI